MFIAASESNDGYQTNVGRVWVARSLDNGGNWQPPQQLGSLNSKGSSIAVAADGTVYVSWVDYALGQVLISRSTDHGETFSAPEVVSDMFDNLAMRPFGWQALPFRTYPYFLDSHFAPNFPALAVDKSPGATQGNLYLTWAEYPSGAPAPATQNIGQREPNDTPQTAQPVPLDSDIFGTLPDVHQKFDADCYVFNLVKGETIWIGGQTFDYSTGWVMGMELADGSFRSVENQVLKSPTEVPTRGQPKPTVFTAPRTGRYFISLFSGINSRTYQLSLRHYLPAPGSVARDQRDIVLARSTDGGRTWSPKVRVNHDAVGADQAMPNVAVDQLGRVYVAWYDWREAVDGDGVNAYAAISHDGGQTFGEDFKLSSRSSAWIGPTFDPGFLAVRPGEMIGDRIAVAAGANYGVVAWTDLRDWPASSDVYAAQIVDVPTAVEAVSNLSAEPVASGVRLTWLVNDAHGIAGLRVFRAHDGEAEVPLGAADILPTGAGRLEYVDATAEPGETYDYRLQVRQAGATQWLGPVTVTLPAPVMALAWHAAWPNPFARRTTVKLAVPRPADGVVRVYDVQGKEVRTLAAGRFEPGERNIEWDGRDASGGIAAPGLYFVAASVGGETARLRLARVP